MSGGKAAARSIFKAVHPASSLGGDPRGPRCSSQDSAALHGGGDEKTRVGADPLKRERSRGHGQGRELTWAADTNRRAARSVRRLQVQDTRGLTCQCSPESSNTNALLRLSRSLESGLCFRREFLSIFSRSLALVSTKPFLQYTAWGTPFFRHSATKSHSCFILERPAEAAVTVRVIAIPHLEKAAWVRAWVRSFARPAISRAPRFCPAPLSCFLRGEECRRNP